MADKLHKLWTVDDGVHIIQAWETFDQTERGGLVLSALDIGKVCRQLDDNSFWLLVFWEDIEGGAQWAQLNPAPVDLSGKANREFAINVQTGTAYTFADSDELVLLGNAAAITATVPPNADVPIPIGRQITPVQNGAGQVTIVPGAGVTLEPALTNKTRALNSPLTLVKIGTDTWKVFGDAATS